MTTQDPMVGDRSHPAAAEIHYERPTWLLGEVDEPTAVMAGGHDRRAVAALSAALRSAEQCGGIPGARTADVERLWVQVHTECGCTEDAHAQHRRAADTDDADTPLCGSACLRPGLPPCARCDHLHGYDWIAVPTTATDPDAVPVVITGEG
ncbi:MAG TPA: hypothetical protein VGD67_26995 [Pseudonocardiaceae bacterium]